MALGVLAACLTMAPATATQLAEPQPLRADITLLAQAGLQRLPLSLEVLQHARSADWSDVVIVDAQGQAVPQAWASEPATAAAARWLTMALFVWPRDPSGASAAAHAVPLELDATGAVLRLAGQPASAASLQGETAIDTEPATAWLLDLHDWRTMPRTLRLHWSGPAEGLRRQIRVERSDDAQKWEQVAESTLLDAPGRARRDVVRRDIRLSDFGAAAPRFLRLRADQPLNLVRIEAEAIDLPNATPMEQARVVPTREPDGDAAGPAWLLDLQGPVPLRQMQVHLPDGDLELPLQVSWRQNPQDPWRFSAQHTAFRLTRDGKTLASAPFDLHAPAARYWRIASTATRPGSEAAAERLDGLEVTVSWQAPQLIFDASVSGPLQLVAGSTEPQANNQPLFALVPSYRSGSEHQLPLASLDKRAWRQLESASWVPGEQAASALTLKRALLWAVLIAAVAALLGLAYKLLRDLKATAEPALADPLPELHALRKRVAGGAGS